ncbi:NECTIN2 isoform 5, partial [Pan troglodytes]
VIHAVDSLFNTTFVCTVTNAVGMGRAEQEEEPVATGDSTIRKLRCWEMGTPSSGHQ